MTELEKLKADVKKIKARNAKVEKDKAWEISWTRRVAIAAIIYILASIFLWLTATRKPFFNGLIPAVAYLLSTSTLEYLKSNWLKKSNA